MDADFEEMLNIMERVFRDFEAAVPRPELVRFSYGYVFRFREKSIHQVLIQKLARVQSALRAAHLLLKHGYIQEQGVLHRVIDETNEDILFLVYAITNDRVTELHEHYLAAFWEEEFNDAGDALSSEQKREMIPRKKIRAYLANLEGAPVDPSRGVELGRTISKTYSGYVHGASPHIMDTYGGFPPRFHTQGMLGTPRIDEHTRDLWNYMYRGFLSHIFVAKAFGAAEHVEFLIKKKEQFEANVGKDYYSAG